MQYLQEYLDRDTSVLIFRFLDSFESFTLKEIKDTSIGISDWNYVAYNACCDSNRDDEERIEILKYCLSKGVILGNFCFKYSATLGIVKYLEGLIPNLTPRTYVSCMQNAIKIKNMEIIKHCQKQIGHIGCIVEDSMSISAHHGNFECLKYFGDMISNQHKNGTLEKCMIRAAGGNQVDMIKHLYSIYERPSSRIWFDCMVQCIKYDAIDTLKYCESRIIDGNVMQREQHKCEGKVTHGCWFVLIHGWCSNLGTKTYEYCESRLFDKKCHSCETMRVSYY
uniref:Ankyrin repeat protein n=1 Tax=Pithovirus LCPAC401 TaxID=2506595 RepID=A0A481ZB36_9VIRU|nr:MAG: hypothetical protein LCPAC401_03030 [Pithovirus LCPAC401]